MCEFMFQIYVRFGQMWRDWLFLLSGYVLFLPSLSIAVLFLDERIACPLAAITRLHQMIARVPCVYKYIV